MVAEIIEIDSSCGQILKLNTFNPDLQVLDFHLLAIFILISLYAVKPINTGLLLGLVFLNNNNLVKAQLLTAEVGGSIEGV